MMMGKSAREGFSPEDRNRILLFTAFSLAFILCVLVLVELFLSNAEKLVALGLIGHLYYIVLSLVGLSAAAFLFGALRSSAKYRGRQFGGALELGGPVVVFALVIVLGFVLPPPPSNFPVTVFVHEAGSAQNLRGIGYVVIDTGGLRRKAPIDKDGTAVFLEIPASFRGQVVPVYLDADGYELADLNQKLQLNGSSFYLEVRQKAGRIAGHVKSDIQTPLAGVAIAVGGITTLSDAAGHFELAIPGGQLGHDLTLLAVAPGYVPWRDTVVPNANDITITLHRQR
jgi:hypothetical protein